jgi:hypothetical protein
MNCGLFLNMINFMILNQLKRLNKTMDVIAILIKNLLAQMEFDIFVPSFSALQNQLNLSSLSLEVLYQFDALIQKIIETHLEYRNYLSLNAFISKYRGRLSK